jgi:hypothetical protein
LLKEKARMVEETISVMRIPTRNSRYRFRDRSIVENLFFVILELRLILVWVPAYTQTAYTSRVFFRKVPAKRRLSLLNSIDILIL